jgi:hypothetical protein
MGEVLLWHCTTLWADDARYIDNENEKVGDRRQMETLNRE